MGAITRAAANNFTTGGVILPAAINDTTVASIDSLSQVTTGGALTLLNTTTITSNTATVSFSSSLITSTYRTYLIKYINVHPETDEADLTFNGSTDNGSSYNVTKTTSAYYYYHNEADNSTGVDKEGGHDMAQGTGFCQIPGDAVGSDNDQSVSGFGYIFSPLSTTFLKHFWFSGNAYTYSDYTVQETISGYFNTTSAVNNVQIKFSTGNIGSGIFKFYGIT